MLLSLRRYSFVLALPLLLATAMCGDDDAATGSGGSSTVGGAGGTGGSGGGGATGGTGGSGGVDQGIICDQLMLGRLARDEAGPFGIRRNELADDVTLTMRGGEAWTLSDHWTGCDAYVFLTNRRPNSSLDDTSLWARDINTLLNTSPPNAHYFFIASRDEINAQAELAALEAVIETAFAADDGVRAYWTPRLHVVDAHAGSVQGWVGTVLGGIGRGGFAIDRAQKIRTLGSFADVTRFRQDLSDANVWPWESNLSYAALEVRHFNYEAKREERHATETATVVTAWDGEILAEVVETDVMFPSANEMAAFDHLEIDLTMQCPDLDAGEFGNCGEWDYLAHIYVQDEDLMGWTELGRFISTYHRQGRYVVDATAALPFLKSGGMRRIRYNVSPPWNPQDYITKMDFRFANRSKGYTPTQTTKLYQGGDFNALYNDLYEPIVVAIPTTAKRVELWAVITGHGGETQNCAEFCDHNHEFTVNGQTHLRDHPKVGQQQGCVGEVDNGMVPNQGGSWWFGRGGWCPGQQVEPWIVDVTAEVTPGQDATISYQGLLNSTTPPDNAGNIVMESYLVVYE